MNPDDAVFSNPDALKALCRDHQPFNLLYSVGSMYDSELRSIIRLCLKNRSCKGVAFLINKEKFFYSDLFFLKNLIETLLFGGKKVGIWGCPPCVSRGLLGGYLYMRMLHSHLPEEIICDDKTSNKHKTYKKKCPSCIDYTGCHGLGTKNFQTYTPYFKKKNSLQDFESLQFIFKSHNKLLYKKHRVFVQHCQRIESRTTYRDLFYVKNFDFHSPHSYRNRFIYECDYLIPEEYSFEFNFLKKNAINKSYIELFENISNIDKISQIGYSLAENKGTIRESFYISVINRYGTKVLHDLGIKYDIPRTKDMRFIGTGIDVIKNDSKYFKLYFLSSKDFIIRYFEPYDIKISKINNNYCFVVLRLDQSYNFLSYKIELKISFDELDILRTLLPDLNFFKQSNDKSKKYDVAIEFVDDKISKINIYHKEQFA